MKLKPFTLVIAVILLIYPTQTFSQNVKKVAILETVDKENKIGYATELLIRSTFATAISLSPGYEGYNRTNIDQILKEQNFQRTGLVSREHIKSLGEMMGAQYVLIAEAAMFDDSRTILITASVTDVETGEVIKSMDGTSHIDPDRLKENCRTIAKLLFGLISGGRHSTSQSTEPQNYQPSYGRSSAQESEPCFDGGSINNLPTWVSARVRYPADAAARNISGRVVVEFVIESDGSMHNITVLQSPHPSLSDEVIRVLRSTTGWKPGYAGNIPVRYTATLPVDFKLYR